MCSINHEKKAIFLHIGKTAGMYIRENLEKYYGFELFLLKRTDHVEFVEFDELEKNLNENKLLTFCCKKGIIDYYKTSEFINDIMEMNESKWNEYFKFVFVRNPYDRAVSGWNYNMETNNLNIDFNIYMQMESIVNQDEYWHCFLPQSESVIDENDNYFVNFVGKFENLEEDFQIILKKIGFKKILHNPEIKKNNRNHDSYKKYYDQKTLDIVNRIYEKDFELFGYKKYEFIEDFLSEK
jgi:hypothetical protein